MMTLPHEEALAIARVRRFLYDLLDPKATPRVPREIRRQAHRLAKHYPLLPSIECAQGMATEWMTTPQRRDDGPDTDT